MSTDKVSVFVTTYNHENYIAQCLDSILSQKTTFDFEIVITDDASTDNTQKIISDYKSKFGSIINEQLNTKNVGATVNCFQTLDRCKAEYIATLGGDDYWIDDNKLQKQIDALDANKDAVLHYTNCHKMTPNNEKSDALSFIPESQFDLNYYFDNNCFTINPQTSVFRKDSLPTIWEDWMYNSINQDWILFIMILKNGKAIFENEYPAVYRLHPTSVTHSMPKASYYINGINTTKKLNEYINFKFKNVLNQYHWMYERIFFDYLKDKKYASSFKYLILHVKNKGINLNFIKSTFKVIFKGYTPKF